MSADNYIAIYKEGEEYVGYHRSASMNYKGRNRGGRFFKVATIEEAIAIAQKEYTEHGYRFMNLKEVK